MAKRKSISWWEPRWAHVPRYWRELRRLMGLRFWVKTMGISLLIFTVIVAACKIAFPALQLEFLWKVPISLVGLPLVFALPTIIPQFVTVHQDYVHHILGQIHRHYKMPDVTSVRIVIFAENRIRMRLFTAKGSRGIGISPKVNLEELYAIFPMVPVVWDARDRFAALSARHQKQTG